MKKRIIYQMLMMFILMAFCILVSGSAYAAGVEDMLVDLSDYLSSRLIPAASAAGIGIGGIMAALGSPKGVEVIKYSIIGGILGTAGAETISMLFF